jgi:hypothetical protein
MPVILATQKAEIRRITVRSQPWQMVPQDPISKNPSQKIGLVEWLNVKALSSSPSTTHTHTHTKVQKKYLVEKQHFLEGSHQLFPASY